jgi:hypothetical protein
VVLLPLLALFPSPGEGLSFAMSPCEPVFGLGEGLCEVVVVVVVVVEECSSSFGFGTITEVMVAEHVPGATGVGPP